MGDRLKKINLKKKFSKIFFYSIFFHGQRRALQLVFNITFILSDLRGLDGVESSNNLRFGLPGLMEFMADRLKTLDK